MRSETATARVAGLEVAGPFRALEHTFDVACTDGSLSRFLRSVLTPLSAPGPARTRYVLEEEADGWCLTANGSLVCGPTTREHAARMLLWHVNQRAVAESEDLVVLHAAAACDADGRAVLLPAAMQSGKSTLVAALVADGLDYLSDELVALEGTRLHAYPKAVSLDPGSWPLFAHLDPRTEPHGGFHDTQWQVHPGRVREHLPPEGASPALVIFPTYDPTRATSLTPIDRDQALLGLVSCAFGLHLRPEENLATLGPLAQRVPAYGLTVSDLDAASALVRRTLSSTNHPEIART